MEIREFRLDDRQRVESFFARMGGESRAFFNRGRGNENWALEFFSGRESHPDILRWMLVEGDAMLGYVFLWDTATAIPWLGIAVAEEQKGKGLGKTLLRHALTWAKENGKGGVLLTTHTANLRGQGLYEGQGFERLGIHTSGEILYLRRF